MPSYDLAHEPWLPVRLLDGTRTVLGLRDVLVRAHEVRELATDAPLETVALARFLLAAAHHAFPELADEAEWIERFEAGRFPGDRVDAYLAEHAGAFDLLDAVRPFYQHPEPLVKAPSSVARLFNDAASGNNPTLFSHDLDDAPTLVPADVAARALVTMQASALGGGVSKPFYLSHAPLVGVALFWMRGASLFEALLLNLPPAGTLRPWRDDADDAPAWARPLTPADRQKRPPAGILDYLTWQSRRLRLEWEERDGRLFASSVWMSQGDKVEPMPLDEPMAAYRGSERKGLFPMGLQADRAIWRDAHIFLSESSATGHPPLTLEWVANSPLELGDERARDRPLDVDVFGMVNDKAKIELWRQERFPLYLSFLRDDAFAGRRRKELSDALAYAEDQARGPLFGACFTFARRLRFPGHEGGGLGKQERAEVRASVDALGADRLFWSAVQQDFYPFLEHLARADDEDAADAAASAWRTAVVRNVWRAFEDATGSLGVTAATYRARAESEDVLRQAYTSTQTNNAA